MKYHTELCSQETIQYGTVKKYPNQLACRMLASGRSKQKDRIVRWNFERVQRQQKHVEPLLLGILGETDESRKVYLMHA